MIKLPNADHIGHEVWGMNRLRPLDGIVGSNLTQGMDVCVCVVLCVGSGRADPPSKESCRLYIGIRNWKMWPNSEDL
jgi:hypothetical protein